MASVDYVQGAFLKLSVNSDLIFERKQEQKIAANCLQKKILERRHPNHSQKSQTVSCLNGGRVHFSIKDGGRPKRKTFERLLSELKCSQFGRFRWKPIAKKERPLLSRGEGFKPQAK